MEPKRTPNGPRVDPERTPNGFQADPERIPNGPRTNPERTPNGPFQLGLAYGSRYYNFDLPWGFQRNNVLSWFWSEGFLDAHLFSSPEIFFLLVQLGL